MSGIDWEKRYSLNELWRRVLRYGLIGAIVGGVVLLLGSVAMVEYTAQPEFCTSCHNMVPYYNSWKESTHKDVPCISCHYEPGMVEAVAGKFAALSQVAKYVTRTEGTKPWAEVSDNSCLRSGCHSKPLLWGELTFGRVKFNHRQHLLQVRRGRKLQCTTCHSQIVQGSHLTVSTSTCFACHFLGSKQSQNKGACKLCHEPPEETIQVDGKPFVHSDWLDQGASCQDCHNNVTRGDGQVSRSRCQSCHGEREYLARYDDTDFIHENHVTEHKVECLECHNEIVHSLAPLEVETINTSKSADSSHRTMGRGEGECAACHGTGHSLQERFFKGVADPGLKPMPSRMSQVRVSCDACHKPFEEDQDEKEGLTMAQRAELGCQMCHGPSFQGMLDQWQVETRGYFSKLQPQWQRLSDGLAHTSLPDQERDAAQALIDQSGRRLDLVEKDGSWGVHNLPYVRTVLASALSDMKKAGQLIKPPVSIADVSFRPAVQSTDGCTLSCHTQIETLETVTLPTREFPHQFHAVMMGLPCSTCHAAKPHGTTPILEANGCADCHHTDGADCTKCHDF